MDDKTYEFTPEQEQAIGELVADRWGDNFQTSFALPGVARERAGNPVLWSQTGPNQLPRRCEIAPDGTVFFGG